MNLYLTEEQELLRDSVDKLLRRESTPQRVREAEAAGGFDPRLWDALVELGVPTMRVPEAGGGGGMGLLDAAVVAEVAGRHLASVPLAETLAAARLLSMLNGNEADAWSARVRDAGARAVLALHELGAEPGFGGVQLVPGGAAADLILFLDGQRVLGLAPAEPLEAPRNLGSGPLARVDLRAARAGAVLLAEGPAARSAYLAAVEEWKLLTAAMMVGLARQALEMAAAYSRERVQFGKPIGGFQGVAHPLADSAADVDGARLLVQRAVWAIARGRADAAAAIPMAFWWAGQAARHAVTRSLRTFGGYGLSLEYDIQLYFRRGKAIHLPAGDPARELQRIGDRLWAGEAAALPDTGPVSLEFGYGEAAERFAAEARAFFEKTLTPELRAKAHYSTDGHDEGFHKALAKAGLLFPDWPTDYGGQGRSYYELSALAVVYEEFGWTRIMPGTTNMGARMAMLFGSEELKREVLPRFADGSALSCLGFSEPGSGSDMFAAKTRSVRDGDDWIINGQKMFTTGGHMSDYVLLLTRSDPEAQKHRGLTIFLMPMTLPGVSVQAVHTVNDERTNITFYENVRCPDRYRLGQVNKGIEVMAAAMALEHGGEGYHIHHETLYRKAVDWARSAKGPDGRPRIDDPAVRARLAVVAVHTEAADLLCRRAVWAKTEGIHNAAWGPMSKLFTTDTGMRDAADLIELAAPDSLLQGHGGAGELEAGHRHSMGSTIYGGTSEVHRSIVAEQDLGMPRSRD
jgi:alkylation response protein AidB-like acyl-CoA dehydrogenase